MKRYIFVFTLFFGLIISLLYFISPQYAEEIKESLIDRFENYQDKQETITSPKKNILPYPTELLEIESDFGIIAKNLTLHQDEIASKQFLTNILSHLRYIFFTFNIIFSFDNSNFFGRFFYMKKKKLVVR